MFVFFNLIILRVGDVQQLKLSYLAGENENQHHNVGKRFRGCL